MIKQPTFESFRKAIFKLDRDIRYFSVVDRNGRIIEGGMRKGVRALEPKEEELRLMAHIVSESSTRETWDRYFGKTLYTIVRRENVTLMVFPNKKGLFLLTAEPDFSLPKIPEIREILARYIR
jgi:hypothetical protein